MGIWSWARRIVTETGHPEPIPVGLERNPGAVVELGAHNPPDVPLYLLRVELDGGFGAEAARIPVHRHRNPAAHPVLKEIYSCELAGKLLEAANVFALRDKVRRQLEVIAPARTLPLCYFRAARFDYSLPVYRRGSGLACPVLAGPRIRAADLSAIRGPVVRHMRSAGYLGEDEAPEVLVVRPSDLRLVPPAAVVRSLEDPALWLPVVEGSSPDGPVVGLLSHLRELRRSERRRHGPAAPDVPPSAPDVASLLRYLGHELSVRGHLAEPSSLLATDVRPEIWARTEELTDRTGARVEGRLEGGESLEVPVLHTAAGELVAGLDEHGITVFMAVSHDALVAAIGGHLHGRGFLRRPGDLRAEAARDRPPESLDPDSIRGGHEVVGDRDQEVESTWSSP